jgi:Ser/Thr protein kinase RdoA (MazF antagonist)
MLPALHTIGHDTVPRPWGHLTRVGRLRRTRHLAEVALSRYDLPGARLSFLRAADNMLYRVFTPDSGHFLLRLQEPARRSTDQLRSELLWLLALRHEGGFAVPEPIPTRDGALFAEVTIDGVPGSRRAVVLRWVEGRRRAGSLTTADARRMGVCMARLHSFARGWSAPAGFARPGWDPERWVGAASPLWARGMTVYTEAELAVFAAAARRCRREVRALGETPEAIGMIHADFAPSNVIFRGGAAHAIDFEECGWGYYQFDIAVALTALADYGARGDQLQAAFLDGYRRESPSPAGDALIRATFMAIVLMKIVAWTIEWDDPALRPRSADYLAHAVDRLRRYVEHREIGPDRR